MCNLIHVKKKSYLHKSREVLKTDSFHDSKTLFFHTIQFVAVDNTIQST